VEDQDAENNGVGPTDQNLFDETQDTTQRRFVLPGLLPQAEYEDLMESLNTKQKNYVLGVVHSIKAKTQMLEYLGGGAGVGKVPLFEPLYKVLRVSTCLKLEEDQTYFGCSSVLLLG